MPGLSMWKAVQMSVLVFLVYSAVLIPSGAILWFGVIPLVSEGISGFLLGMVILHLNIWIFLLSAVVIPGLSWRILKLRYRGTHLMDLSDPQVRNWIVTHMIYIPTAVVLDFFHLYPLKALHVKLFGAKIGKDVVVGGMITDPSLLEVDENTNIGGFSRIMGHSVEGKKVVFNQVSIGRNCGVGISSNILPGAELMDGAMLGAQSILLKNRTIPAGKTFAGNPAREIKILNEGDKK